mgnify:CR=1 FL=1
MREYLLDTNIYIDSYDRYYRYKESALTAQVRGWANEDIADPWIIAIAKELGLTIVTEEQKVPNLGQGNPVKSAKIPDICDDWGVRCISRNDFFEEVKLTV